METPVLCTFCNCPKSVRNRCATEVFDGVFVLSHSFLCELSVFIGAFIIGLTQICFFFLLDDLRHQCAFPCLLRMIATRVCSHTVKKGDLTQSYDNNPYINSEFENQWTAQKRHQNSITQRLRTDLGRSVGVPTVIQLLWLNRYTGTQPSH